MPRLGYVGLGTMGGRMVARLLARGHAVTGYNRTQSKAEWLIEKGMAWADSPRAVAGNADIVFVMVTDSRALEAVMRGSDGILDWLRAEAIVIDMSTVSPETSRALARAARDRGAAFLDAPVSGSVQTLESGRLSIMVGGERADFERVRPVLEDIGPRVTYVGPNGSAVSMKIATNLGLAVQMLAFSEAVLLAEKAGISRDTAVDVLTHSVVASPMIQYRGPFVLQMPNEAWFDVAMMQKDLRLALEMGQQMDMPLPTTAIANEFLTAARALGLADRDFAILFNVLAKMAGVPA